ncbi:hypothetical protein MMC07_005205 [Pseudocyphellaria aurata]|nr:hypothetical protein [Pseudocyphellaria aurata]
MPGAVKDLSSFYADAGYSIPSSTTPSSRTIASPSPTPTSANGTSALPYSTSPTESTLTAAPSGFRIAAKVCSGLSTAAKVGIGVGNVVAIVLVVCVVLVFLRHQQKRKTMTRNTLHLPSDTSGRWVGAAKPPARKEMDEPGRVEMHGKTVPAELGRPEERYEM